MNNPRTSLLITRWIQRGIHQFVKFEYLMYISQFFNNSAVFNEFKDSSRNWYFE